MTCAVLQLPKFCLVHFSPASLFSNLYISLLHRKCLLPHTPAECTFPLPIPRERTKMLHDCKNWQFENNSKNFLTLSFILPFSDHGCCTIALRLCVSSAGSVIVAAHGLKRQRKEANNEDTSKAPPDASLLSCSSTHLESSFCEMVRYCQLHGRPIHHKDR